MPRRPAGGLTPADEGIAAAQRDARATRNPGIDRANLAQTTDNLDQALYVASVLCANGPMTIYCTTDPEWAAPETGELYIVTGADVARHVRDDQGWEPVYVVSKPAAREQATP